MPDKASPQSCKVCCATAELALFLYKIYFSGSVCRLCINCLLKNHHGMFCPICFDVYEDTPPPPHLHIMCLKCPSIAHRSCVVDASDSDAPIPAFHCPSCADSKFSYFKLDRSNPSIKEAKNADGVGDPVSVTAQNADGEGDPDCFSAPNADEDGDPVSVSARNADGEGGSISASAQNAHGEGDFASGSSTDKESAKVIDAAAQIAVSSMRKALSAAMIDAEQRMEEVTLARKKVQEALDQVVSLLLQEKDAEEAKNADAEGDPVSVSSQNANGQGGSVSVSAQNAHEEEDSVSGSSMVLDAAARIAGSSMRKPLYDAVIDARQRMKEAVLASKKVQEALDYVASLLPEEKDAEEDST